MVDYTQLRLQLLKRYKCSAEMADLLLRKHQQIINQSSDMEAALRHIAAVDKLRERTSGTDQGKTV
jgi:hypothetical protein